MQKELKLSARYGDQAGEQEEPQEHGENLGGTSERLTFFFSPKKLLRRQRLQATATSYGLRILEVSSLSCVLFGVF